MSPANLYLQGLAALAEQQHRKAFRCFSRGAQAGETACFRELAALHAAGLGTVVNTEQALFWYKKYFKTQTDSNICIEIARVYFSQPNPRQAVYWLEKAVDLGNAQAAFEYVKHLMSKKKIKSDVQIWQLLTKVVASNDLSDAQRQEAFILITQLSGL